MTTKTKTTALDGLVNEHVEIRTGNGGAYRGRLVGVGVDWAKVELNTGGLALVRLSACSAVVVDDAAARRRERERAADEGEQ